MGRRHAGSRLPRRAGIHHKPDYAVAATRPVGRSAGSRAGGLSSRGRVVAYLSVSPPVRGTPPLT